MIWTPLPRGVQAVYGVVHYDVRIMVTRQPVQIRLSTSGLAELDRVAAEWEATRSDVIRAILGHALVDPALLAKLKATMKKAI